MCPKAEKFRVRPFWYEKEGKTGTGNTLEDKFAHFFRRKGKRRGKIVPLRHHSQKLTTIRVCTAHSCSNQVFDLFFFVKGEN